MRKPAHQSLRLFYSWLLLALFTAPIIIKGVHVCHYNNVVLTDGHTTYTKSTVQEADKCPICHFMFPAFSSAEVVQFAFSSSPLSVADTWVIAGVWLQSLLSARLQPTAYPFRERSGDARSSEKAGWRATLTSITQYFFK